MKILIHALGAEMGGAIRHLTNFLPELGRQDQKNHYVVFTKQTFPEINLPENIKLEKLDGLNSWAYRLFVDNILIPWRLRKESYDLLITLTNFGPFKPPCKHILFQRNSLYYCNYYLKQISGKLKLETFIRRKLAIEAMKFADLIITPSYAMTDMIKLSVTKSAYYPFYTLYHGFEQKMISTTFEHRASNIEFPKGFPILFYASHLGEYKGFRILFDSVRKLKSYYPDIKLILTIGKNDNPRLFSEYKKIINELNINQNILTIGSIPQNHVGYFYDNAHAIIFPSLCESFGFPMLEALSAQLPIIAADTPINREICNNAAVYYNPINSDECAKKTIKVLSDNKLQTQLKSSAVNVLNKFNWGWERYVEDFLKIISSVVK